MTSFFGRDNRVPRTVAVTAGLLLGALVFTSCSGDDPTTAPSETPSETQPSYTDLPSDPRVKANPAKSAAYAELLEDTYDQQLVLHEGRAAWEALIEEQLSLQDYIAEPITCLPIVDSELLHGMVGAIGVASDTENADAGETHTTYSAILEFPDTESAIAYVDARREAHQQCDTYDIDLLDDMNFTVTTDATDFAGIADLEAALAESAPAPSASEGPDASASAEPVDTAWVDQLEAVADRVDDTLYVDTHSALMPDDEPAPSPSAAESSEEPAPQVELQPALTGRSATALVRVGQRVIITSADFLPAEAELGRIVTDLVTGITERDELRGDNATDPTPPVETTSDSED